MKTKFCLSLLTLTSVVVSTQPAISQTYQPTNRTPVADSTLGTQVSGNGNNFNITGGVNKGRTLFHSFTDFSVPTNGQANFLNPVGNRDIITRVTGNVFSDINGTVNTNGANFFLINPNGIVFGTNAQLNVGKAFVGSTANSIDLVDAGGRTITFGTNANGDAPLLSIAPNVLFDVSRLNMGGGNGAISNFGTLQTTNLNQYIGLIGGNVTMNGGEINAPGGRVELGGLSSVGTVALGVDVNNLTAQFQTNVARGNISLTNGARVNVAGAGGGDIAISARNLQILGGSVVRGGIEEGLGTPEAVAGDIKLNATGDIVVGSNSLVFTAVRLNSKGQGGNITIDTGSFSLRDGAQLSASTAGQGNAGNVIVKAKESVSLTGRTVIFSNVDAGGVGKGGTIEIDAASLSLRDGSLQTATLSASDPQPAGEGAAGNVTVRVTGAVDIAGIEGTYLSGIRSTIGTGVVGKGGNVSIDAGSFSLRDGAQLEASTYGQGDAGNVTVTTKDAVSLVGNAYIFSTVEAGGVGKGGNIDIKAGSLSLKDAGQLGTFTRGASDPQPAGKGGAGNVTVTVTGAIDMAGTKDGFSSGIFSYVDPMTVGNGGNITIDAGSLSLRDGAKLEASTYSQGKAGDLTIKASNVEVSELSFITADTYGTGNAGDLTITTDLLRIVDGAQISASTVGSGNAGNLRVKATSVEIDRESPRTSNSAPVPTGLFAQVEPSATGNAGDLTLTTKKLSVSNGGKVQAATFGKGNGGNLVIKADEIDIFESPGVNPFQLTTINAGIGFDLDRNFDSDGNPILAEGKGGNLTIETRRLSVRNRAAVSSDTRGIGDGGRVSITATDRVEVSGENSRLTVGVNSGATGNGGDLTLKTQRLIVKDGGEITAKTLSGQGGNINLNVSDYLLMRGNSQISATAGTAQLGGDGGNITINSPLIIALPGNNDITANAYTGKGGNLNIKSEGLFGIQYRSKGQESNFTNDITASSQFNQQGTVNIETPGTDPGRDSTELPNTTTDASNQISQVCSANNRQNKLTVTGRGGLPPNANDPLTSDVVWQDARAASSQPAISSATNNSAKLPPPAVGWVFDGKGKVTLVAAATPGQPTGTRVACPQGVSK